MIQLNGLKSSDIHEASLKIVHGGIQNKEGDACDGGFISINQATFTPQSCDNENLQWEIKHLLNFKSKFYGRFYSECMQKYNGCIEIMYKCERPQFGCNDSCSEEKKTCLLTSEGSKCDCLKRPSSNNEWEIICSGANYLGCYNLVNYTFEVNINVSRLLSPSTCLKACQVLGYTHAMLAGVSAGCFCTAFKSQSKSVEDKFCLSACSFDPTLSCGKHPYVHVFSTGILKSACTENLCPNGTECVSIYDVPYCMCNQTSPEKPAGCYGCLNGWQATHSSDNCYKVTNMTLASPSCKSIHGTSLTVNSLRSLMFIVRLILNDFITKDYEAGDERILFDMDKDAKMIPEFPICERKKTPVTGKYPWTKWPGGSYGLPMPKSGCPQGHQFSWETGFYTQNMEHTSNANKVSPSLNLEGFIKDEIVRSAFCIKTNPRGSEWPDGRYCIYKKGDCPEKMVKANIFWDDEDNNNTNMVKGVLPDGMFKKDTEIYFCCLESELKDEGIVLPRDHPFYLFPYLTSTCQHVVGMSVTLEYIQYDLENFYGKLGAFVARGEKHPYAEITSPDLHLKLFYCYYKPERSCGHPPFSKHLQLNTNNTYWVGTVLNYTCEQGYRNIGDEYDVCLPSEHWSSVDGPKCIDMNECNNENSCHVKANCYNIDGSYYCKCNRGWNGDGHHCTITKCKLPSPPQNGYFDDVTKHSFTPREKVSVACRANHHLIGCNDTMCLESGKWDEFPKCVESARCVRGTNKCSSVPSDDSTVQTQRKTCCSCQFVEASSTQNSNPLSTTMPAKIGDQYMLTKTVVMTTGTIAIVAIVMVMLIFGLIKCRRQNRDKGEKETINGSIYADIEEFKLNLEVDKRKESASSVITNNTDTVPITAPSKFDQPPCLPPRTSICDSERRLSLFQRFSDNRRRSDLGSSDLFLIPSKQLNESATQFKLNSVSKRRNCDLTNFHPSISPLNLPSNKIVTPISESDEDGENPYIDVYGTVISDGSCDDLSDFSEICSEHYGKVPRNTLRLSLRHRSYTVTNPLHQRQTVHNQFRVNRSKSFTEGRNVLIEQRQLNVPERTESDASSASDDVFFAHKNDDESAKNSAFSLKFKFTSVLKKRNCPEQSDTLSELTARLRRYKLKCSKNGRNRSDTNPV